MNQNHRSLSNSALSVDEFKESLSLFVGCHELVLKRRTTEEQKKIYQWLSANIYPMVALFTARRGDIQKLHEDIFRHELIRDYYSDLGFMFFSMCGFGEDYPARLALSLTNGLMLDGPDYRENLIPAVLQHSMVSTIFGSALPSWKRWWLRLRGSKVYSHHITSLIQETLYHNRLWMLVLLATITSSDVIEPETEDD